MTYLIDCYESITSQLSSLNISSRKPSDSIIPENNQSKPPGKYSAIMQKTIMKHYCEAIYHEEYGWEFFSIWDNFSIEGYEVFCRVRFDELGGAVCLRFGLLKNGLPISVKSMYSISNAANYFLNINSQFDIGGFKINPINGEIFFSIINSFLPSQFDSFFHHPQKMIQFLEENFLVVKKCFIQFLPKILVLINVRKKKQVAQPSSNPQIQFLEKIHPFLHLKFPFMFNHQLKPSKPSTPELTKQLLNAVKMVKNYKKLIDPDLLSVFQTRNKLIPVRQKVFTNKDQNDCFRILLPPVVRHKSGEPAAIYSQIKLLNVDRDWDVISGGGFGTISKSLVKFSYVNDDQFEKKVYTRVIVKKEDKEANSNKIKHERKILTRLASSENPFIAKYFFSNEQGLENSILLEYCPLGSLSDWCCRQFTSLSTKLALLRYIAQGLKTLHSSNILHLDLKPTNIMVKSGHIKIIDFGEAYNAQICGKGYRPGVSMPYAAPESLGQGGVRFCEGMDVFSFGMLAYQLIYGYYPFLYNFRNHDTFVDSYRWKTYGKYLQICPEKCGKVGSEQLISFLTLLILKCLQKDERKRPCIEWIIIFLQYCINWEKNL